MIFKTIVFVVFKKIGFDPDQERNPNPDPVSELPVPEEIFPDLTRCLREYLPC